MELVTALRKYESTLLFWTMMIDPAPSIASPSSGCPSFLQILIRERKTTLNLGNEGGSDALTGARLLLAIASLLERNLSAHLYVLIMSADV
jgi:hypothetical protein